MRRILSVVLVGGSLVVAACGWILSAGPVASADQPGSNSPPSGPPPMRPGGPGGPGGGRSFTGMPTDSFASERDSLMNEVLEHIKGKEQMPAESVFKNIKMLKGVPAGRVLRMMNFGFGRSLGVRCQHCHVLGHWADEDKPQKQIARDMNDLVHAINDDLLPKIKHIQSEHPGVNCGTCHHGIARPGFGPEVRPPGAPGGPGAPGAPGGTPPPGGGGNP